MSSEIQIWLDGDRDYYAGIELLNRTMKVDPARMLRLTGKRQNPDLLSFLLQKALNTGMIPAPAPEPVIQDKDAIKLSDDEMIIKKPDKKIIALKSDLEKKTKSIAYIKQIEKEKGQFYKEYLNLHARLYFTEEGPELAKIVDRIKYLWEKEINPRWQIIDDFELAGIIPEKVKSITIGKLFAELKNIPTKVSRINRLIDKVKEPQLIERYKLQKEVHEREFNELEQLLQQISHMPVEMIKMVMV